MDFVKARITRYSVVMIKALTLDIEKDGWEKSRGFVLRDVPMPTLDEVENPSDATSVIVKVRFAGVCGERRSILWRAGVRHSGFDSGRARWARLDKRARARRCSGEATAVQHVHAVDAGNDLPRAP